MPKKRTRNLTKKTKEFDDQVLARSNDCVCPEGTEILTQNQLPIQCACKWHKYNKNRASGEVNGETTVSNIFQRIRVLDVDEAEKMIYSHIKLYSRWKDDRISITFPNNKSRIVIAKYSPEKEGFPIWRPPRSFKGSKSNSKWKFLFVNFCNMSIHALLCL